MARGQLDTTKYIFNQLDELDPLKSYDPNIFTYIKLQPKSSMIMATYQKYQGEKLINYRSDYDFNKSALLMPLNKAYVFGSNKEVIPESFFNSSVVDTNPLQNSSTEQSLYSDSTVIGGYVTKGDTEDNYKHLALSTGTLYSPKQEGNFTYTSDTAQKYNTASYLDNNRWGTTHDSFISPILFETFSHFVNDTIGIKTHTIQYNQNTNILTIDDVNYPVLDYKYLTILQRNPTNQIELTGPNIYSLRYMMNVDKIKDWDLGLIQVEELNQYRGQILINGKFSHRLEINQNFNDCSAYRISLDKFINPVQFTSTTDFNQLFAEDRDDGLLSNYVEEKEIKQQVFDNWFTYSSRDNGLTDAFKSQLTVSSLQDFPTQYKLTISGQFISLQNKYIQSVAKVGITSIEAITSNTSNDTKPRSIYYGFDTNLYSLLGILPTSTIQWLDHCKPYSVGDTNNGVQCTAINQITSNKTITIKGMTYTIPNLTWDGTNYQLEGSLPVQSTWICNNYSANNQRTNNQYGFGDILNVHGNNAHCLILSF